MDERESIRGFFKRSVDKISFPYLLRESSTSEMSQCFDVIIENVAILRVV